MKYTLDYIWECIECEKIYANNQEKETITKLADIEDKLSSDLNDKQKDLLKDFTDAISDLSYLERKEAFIQGVKFATQFLLNATDLK